jgi:hypothetical protein
MKEPSVPDTQQQPEDWGRGDWMQTYTGKAFYALNPTLDSIDIADIAHALGMLCRYGGHVRQFYSVAEHCVLMSHAVAPENALWALLHDSTEAYMGDLIRPIKRRMPAYAEAERDLMLAICQRFGLDWDQPAEIKEADTRILLDERAVLLGPSPQRWGIDIESVQPLGVTLQCWAPEDAAWQYLERFRELTSAEAGQRPITESDSQGEDHG